MENVLTITYTLSSGETGRDELGDGDKWSVGRSNPAAPPSVAIDDARVSRSALVVRDSGPGPVVFRGQSGEGARVTIVGADGPVRDVPEGTAANLTPDAHGVELWIGADRLLQVEVEFAERGSVRERQDATQVPPD